jgi:hypothetical protein
MALEAGNGCSSGKFPLTSNGYHQHSRRCCPHLISFCDVSKKCYRSLGITTTHTWAQGRVIVVNPTPPPPGPPGRALPHTPLPGGLARRPCPSALPGSLARQPCPAALPGSLARQPCPAALPGGLARQNCKLFNGRRPECSIHTFTGRRPAVYCKLSPQLTSPCNFIYSFRERFFYGLTS